MDEATKFFEGLPKEEKAFAGDILKPQQQETPEAKPEPKTEATAEEATADDVRKNRRHRRLEEALDKERLSNIQLNERLRVLTELNKTPESVEDVDERLERIFGSNDAGKEVSRLFKKVLEEDRTRTIQQVLETVEERVDEKISEPIAEQRQFESFIDEELENLEETHGIDMTSDTPAARKARREFLDLVESVSPKDEAGNLKDFADFEATYAIYERTRDSQKTTSRQKDISSRSMTQSSTGTTGQTADAGPMTFERAKREIGRMFH